MTVIKCGGKSLPKLSRCFAKFVALWQQREPVILVHGGGPAISALEQKLHLQSSFNSRGQRITNTETLEVIVQVLCGSVNSQLVSLLATVGVAAVGISGLAAGLLQAKLQDFATLGWVGEIIEVRTEILEHLCNKGFLPVVAPVSLQAELKIAAGETIHSPGRVLNVNADAAASAIAGAVGAQNMIFVSDIPGILADGKLLKKVNRRQIQQMIAAGAIYGGMIPKVEGALAALENEGSYLEKIYIIDGTSESLLQSGSNDLSNCLQGTCISL